MAEDTYRYRMCYARDPGRHWSMLHDAMVRVESDEAVMERLQREVAE